MTDKTGGPAFPMPGMTGLPNGEFVYGDHGMTLRDYFAAKAMSEMTWKDKLGSARECYEMADAMIAARES